MKFIEKGKLVCLKKGEIGVIADIQDNQILVDLDTGLTWMKVDDVDKKSTALLRASFALRQLEDLLDLEAQKEPEPKLEKVLLPTTPRAPFVERLPPKPREFPEELVERLPEIDVVTIGKISGDLSKLLTNLSKLAEERAKHEEALENIREQMKPIQSASKKIKLEIEQLAIKIAQEVEKSLEGTDEVAHYIKLWKDHVVYFLKWITEIEEEPDPEAQLETLKKVIEEICPPKLVEEIIKKFERRVSRLKRISQELNAYLAIAPLSGFKIKTQLVEVMAQVGIWERVKEFAKRIWEFLKTILRDITGIRTETEHDKLEIVGIVEKLQKIRR